MAQVKVLFTRNFCVCDRKYLIPCYCVPFPKGVMEFIAGRACGGGGNLSSGLTEVRVDDRFLCTFQTALKENTKWKAFFLLPT